MGFLDIFRKKQPSGTVAKDRLELVLISDRTTCSPDIMNKIRDDIIQVISKYMDVNTDDIDIQITNLDIEGNKQTVPTLYANIPIKDIRKENLGNN
ncbi:Cell division topological specificity factor MinE [Lachnospiraceae bacterium TWA4]|nr:Cell division topological specificity factor MinE [Lachnospiraceae bacterium TWA4]